MDNFKMMVQAEGRENLRHLLHVAFNLNAPGGKVVGWFFNEEHGMVLVWSENGIPKKKVEYNKLPTPYDVDQATDFVYNWIVGDGKKGRKDFLDHDGDMGTGFRLHAGDWGHALPGAWGSIIAVQPIYAWYGK